METPKKPARGRKPPAPLSIAPVRDEEEVLELLAPFRAWKAARMPDPRTAPAAAVGEGLVTIITAEGPVLEHRVFHLYTRAAGLARAGRDIVATYRKALSREIKAQRLVAEDDGDGSATRVLRAPGRPAMVLRERGDRTLEEIPLAEISALFRKLELGRGESFASDEERFRRVLESYELLRLTAKTKQRLDLACGKANLPQWSGAITASYETDAPLKAPRPRKVLRRLRHG